MARIVKHLFPQPRRFLYKMSLRTGTELIFVTLLINKFSGVFGLLAVVTGFSLSSLQLTMYLYSVAALLLIVYISPHLRTQSPLQCILAAYFYALDSAVNLLYTVAFAAGWFSVLMDGSPDAATASGPGASTIGKAAGFTSPRHNVSHVEVIAATGASGSGLGRAAGRPGQLGAAIGIPADGPATGSPSSPTAAAGLHEVVLHSSSVASIAVIAVLWILRVYFIIIVFSYARAVLKAHLFSSGSGYSSLGAGGAGGASVGTLFEDPFARGKEAGKSLPARLASWLIHHGESYWLGTHSDTEDAEWFVASTARTGSASASARTGSATSAIADANGTVERERRRRGGTGPPMPTEAVIDFIALKEYKI